MNWIVWGNCYPIAEISHFLQLTWKNRIEKIEKKENREKEREKIENIKKKTCVKFVENTNYNFVILLIIL